MIRSSSQNKQDTRVYVKFIAYMQTICIVLVVLGHSFHEYPDGAHGTSTLLYRMMYSFRVPVFMFVSGYLMVLTTFARNNILSISRFGVKKVVRLLIPFFTLEALVFIPRALFSGLADDKVLIDFSSFFKSLIYSDFLSIPYLWFIQVSFALLIVTYMILWSAHKLHVPDSVSYILLLVAAIALPYLDLPQSRFWSFGEITLKAGFFILGASYGRYCGLIDKYIRWDRWYIFVSWTVMWVFAYFCIDIPFLRGMCGIAMIVSLTKIIEHSNIRILDHLTGSNYMIFLLSWFVNVAAQQVLAHYVSLPWWVYTVLSLVGGVYIPWLFYRLMLRYRTNRSVRVLGFMLGQNLDKYR